MRIRPAKWRDQGKPTSVLLKECDLYRASREKEPREALTRLYQEASVLYSLSGALPL